MVAGLTALFSSAISPSDTRIKQLPPIVLVFGGPLGDPMGSARQLFLNWMMVSNSPVKSLIRTPEQFSDWNKFEGYGNLVDFERDAGHLTKAIVLFSESEGSFAELGAFCMDSVISERLFVVIAKEFYHATSFIAYGPVKKIEDRHHDHSICVMDTLEPAKLEPELASIAAALEEKISSIPRTQAFDPSRHRDKFLLVADLVELFGALTITELDALVKVMEVDLSMTQLRAILNQLKRFDLIELVEGTTKRFFVPPKDRQPYLDYESPKGTPAFERSRFKMLKATPWLQGDAPRFKAYCEIHPKA